jgi:hypothetical protein
MLFVLPPTSPTVRHPLDLSFTSTVAVGSIDDGAENITLADAAVPDVARNESVLANDDASLLLHDITIIDHTLAAGNISVTNNASAAFTMKTKVFQH